MDDEYRKQENDIQKLIESNRCQDSDVWQTQQIITETESKKPNQDPEELTDIYIDRDPEEQELIQSKQERSDYKQIVKRRNIGELIHFTRIENVPTIIQHGIQPRSILNEYAPDAIISDSHRLDGYKNASCLSVSFPNYKMLYLHSQENQDNWAVLSLKPELLYDLDIEKFYFFPINAATSGAEPCDFEEMFGESNSKFPDDPQAEILAFGTIKPEYISKIYVIDLSARYKLSELLDFDSALDIEINENYFKPRKDDYI